MNRIYQPYSKYGLFLKNKIVMAPVTRGFADNDTGEVNNLIADYYGRRARYDAGLIISEGIAMNETAKGTYGIPGIYTEKQVESWKKVTDEVHKENGVIFAQLWHVGRLSHSCFINGKAPIAPSEVKADGLVHKLRKPYETPAPLTGEQIDALTTDYQKAAKNALEAGFDGVEIHSAHGYLIDQFINEKTNTRQDIFGVTIDNRLRLLDKIIASVSKIVPAEKISIRISEKKDDDLNYYWEDPKKILTKIIQVLNKHGIKILHISVNDFDQPLKNETRTLHELTRILWDYTLIGVGNISPEAAPKIIENNEVDLVAFGRLFLSNPDLVVRIRSQQLINKHYNLNELY